MVATAYGSINSQSASGSRRGATALAGQGVADDYYDEAADAVDRDRYYAGVKDSFATADGSELYHSLHKLISRGTRDLGYKEARKVLYSQADRRPDGNLYYLYSGQGPKNESDVKEIVPRELLDYNCEHVVPQSWFNAATPMKSDMHHLFTEQIQCNGSRGNLEFEDLKEGQGETIKACGILDHGDSFEPAAGKGEVARATLYFVTRHPNHVGDNGESDLADVETLLKWHREYPVTDYERHRNDVIEQYQGNRNPFIDFPELAEKVDFKAGFKR
jgi:endonuclease I